MLKIFIIYSIDRDWGFTVLGSIYEYILHIPRINIYFYT